jgi:hypothetical protein
VIWFPEVEIAPATPPLTEKLLAVTVEAFTASLKVTAIALEGATPVAPEIGEVEETVGPEVSGAWSVVKVKTKSEASGLPARSFTSTPMLAVYVVLGARGAAGTKVAVAPATLTVPVTPATVKELGVTVEGCTASLKVTVTVVLTETAAWSFEGEVEMTVGPAVSAGAPASGSFTGGDGVGSGVQPATRPNTATTRVNRRSWAKASTPDREEAGSMSAPFSGGRPAHSRTVPPVRRSTTR